MGKGPACIPYECDRCGYKELIDAERPNASWWHEARRIDAGGIEREFLLCGHCHGDYKKQLADRQDTEFAKFMAERKSDKKE